MKSITITPRFISELIRLASRSKRAEGLLNQRLAALVLVEFIEDAFHVEIAELGEEEDDECQ